MRFTKMQAFGNDYVYIDAIHQELKNLPELARFVSDRHFAIGSDGMVLICPSEKGDFRMRMFNPDGTEGEMCGNALRSVGKYVYDHRLTDKTDLVIETLGGMQHLTLTVTDGLVSNIRADIGEPRLSTAVIPVVTELPEFVEQPVQVLDRTFHITAVSWGNPHCAMYVDSVADLDVEGYGKTIEHMTSIFPNKDECDIRGICAEGLHQDPRVGERNRRDDRMRDRLCDGGCGRRPHRTDRPESDGRADRRTAFHRVG